MSSNAHYDADVPLDRIHRILADPTRRALLELLRETEELPLAVATDRLAAQANGEATDDLAITLVHVHLPKMADAQVIDYDREAKKIRTNGGTDAAYAVMEQVAGGDGE